MWSFDGSIWTIWKNYMKYLYVHGWSPSDLLYMYYSEEIVDGEGVECTCTYAESPGEFYVRPVHLKRQLDE